MEEALDAFDRYFEWMEPDPTGLCRRGQLSKP